MMPLSGLLLFEAMLVAAGLLIVRLLLPRGERHPAELWLPLSFAVGLALHAMLLTGSLATLGWFRAWMFPALATVAVVAHALLWRSRRLAPLSGFAFLARPGPVAMRGFYWLIAFVVLGRIVMLHAEALRFPFFTWDGRYIWNLKAMILFHEGTVFTDAFMDPERVHFHRDYPLLVPGAYLGVYQMGGGVYERMARLFLVHLMVFFLLAFHGAARRHCAPWLAMFLTALLAGMPFRMDYTVRDGITLTTGVADIPLAFFAFLAVILHGRGWRSRQPAWHVLGGIMTGACLLTKSEGFVAFAAIAAGNLAACLFVRGGTVRQRLPLLVPALVVPLFVALPWLVLKSYLPNFYDEKFGDLLAEAGFAPLAERLPVVLSLLGRELLSIRSWNLVWLVFPFAVAAAFVFRLRAGHWFPGVVVLAWLSAYVLAYLVTPLEIDYHVKTSAGRLLSHFHALALLQVALAAGLWMRRSQARRGMGSAVPRDRFGH